MIKITYQSRINASGVEKISRYKHYFKVFTSTSYVFLGLLLFDFTYICVSVHMRCSALIHVRHNMHVEAKELPVGVRSLLPPCGSLESTQITGFGGECLNSLSHLPGPATFVWVGGDGVGDGTQGLVGAQNMPSTPRNTPFSVFGIKVYSLSHYEFIE